MEARQAIESGFESVTAYLGWDRRRLDETLEAVSAAVLGGAFAEAAARYAGFELGRLRRVRLEEELLFPVFEARSGIVNGPTGVMREEHRQVRVGLGLMRQALERADAGLYADGIRFFESVVRDHDGKEEHILFPMLDSLLRPSERAALVARLEREPV